MSSLITLSSTVLRSESRHHESMDVDDDDSDEDDFEDWDWQEQSGGESEQ